MIRRLALLLGVSLAPLAHAWPVDLRLSLEPKGETFRRLSAVDWIEVEDPKIATAEILPSRELMFTAHAPGSTLLLLYAEGRMAVWRLEVSDGAALKEPSLDAAKKACPDLRATFGEERQLTASVQSEACRKALKAYLEKGPFLARELELTFSLEALQGQLGEIERALKEAKLPITAKYVGAGLVLEGEVESLAQKQKALWAAFRESLGRVPLEDRISVKRADAGTAQ